MKIKVTGYIVVADLPRAWVDPDDSTGLTSDGYDAVLGYQLDGENPHEGDLRLGDLEDVELEAVAD